MSTRHSKKVGETASLKAVGAGGFERQQGDQRASGAVWKTVMLSGGFVLLKWRVFFLVGKDGEFVCTC